MRTTILKGVAAAAAFVGLVAVGTAQAAQVQAQVPFGFSVNGKVLPAGSYTVNSDSVSLLIRSDRGGAITLSQKMESRGATPKLVFHRYGDEYILTEVWMGGGSGHKLPQTRRERELAAARNGANTASVQRVEIPLL